VTGKFKGTAPTIGSSASVVFVNLKLTVFHGLIWALPNKPANIKNNKKKQAEYKLFMLNRIKVLLYSFLYQLSYKLICNPKISQTNMIAKIPSG
jgi:hypothetical protein